MRAVKEVRDRMGSSALPVEPEGAVGKVTGYPRRFRQFLHDVRLEMRNVTWPTWNDVKSTTLVVVLTTFFFGFYLGVGLDIPLGNLVSWLLAAARGVLP